MSETHNAPNEEQTTEEDRADNDTAELNWSEAEEAFQAVRETRKRITFPVFNEAGEIVGEVTFEYRMLKEREHNEAEDAAVKIEAKRNKEEITTDSGALKDTLIKHGVTDGPPGFSNTAPERNKLPPYIKEGLASAIEDFSEMPEEDREGF